MLGFVPMLLTSIGYSELNKADPDCGTTYTWATRAFGPRSGWAGGWAIIVADVLVMASLAQVAGQYVFFLFNADRIGADPASGWVLLVGVAWIAPWPAPVRVTAGQIFRCAGRLLAGGAAAPSPSK